MGHARRMGTFPMESARMLIPEVCMQACERATQSTELSASPTYYLLLLPSLVGGPNDTVNSVLCGQRETRASEKELTTPPFRGSVVIHIRSMYVRHCRRTILILTNFNVLFTRHFFYKICLSWLCNSGQWLLWYSSKNAGCVSALYRESRLPRSKMQC